MLVQNAFLLAIYLHTKFHISGSNLSAITNTKPKTKYVVSILLSIFTPTKHLYKAALIFNACSLGFTGLEPGSMVALTTKRFFSKEFT